MFNIYSENQLNFLKKYIYSNRYRNGYICLLATHGFSLSFFNNNLRNAFKFSLVNLPDGFPIAVYQSLISNKRINRIAGPDLFNNLLDYLQTNTLRKRIFLLGGTDESIKIIIKKINNLYPCLSIVGSYSGLINLDNDNKKLQNKINSCNPDLIFVGIGCPKQELWMYANYRKINALMFGFGAAFDFFSSSKKRAPIFMQKYGFEWFFRLLTEPRRLFFRYLIYNSVFIFYFILIVPLLLFRNILIKLLKYFS